MERMTEKEAYEKIQEYIRLAETNINYAEEIADKYKLTFRWDGPAYGMGGGYNGGYNDDESDLDLKWYPSSQSC